MKVSIEKTEHYAMFRLPAGDNSLTALSELMQVANQALDQNEFVYFIFDINGIEKIESAEINSLLEMHDTLLERNGLLICINKHIDLQNTFEENQLIAVPSENEAIEYVMMDQLEKQFLDDI